MLLLALFTYRQCPEVPFFLWTHELPLPKSHNPQFSPPALETSRKLYLKNSLILNIIHYLKLNLTPISISDARNLQLFLLRKCEKKVEKIYIIWCANSKFYKYLKSIINEVNKRSN